MTDIIKEIHQAINQNIIDTIAKRAVEVTPEEVREQMCEDARKKNPTIRVT